MKTRLPQLREPNIYICMLTAISERYVDFPWDVAPFWLLSPTYFLTVGCSMGGGGRRVAGSVFSSNKFCHLIIPLPVVYTVLVL